MLNPKSRGKENCTYLRALLHLLHHPLVLLGDGQRGRVDPLVDHLSLPRLEREQTLSCVTHPAPGTHTRREGAQRVDRTIILLLILLLIIWGWKRERERIQKTFQFCCPLMGGGSLNTVSFFFCWCRVEEPTFPTQRWTKWSLVRSGAASWAATWPAWGGRCGCPTGRCSRGWSAWCTRRRCPGLGWASGRRWNALKVTMKSHQFFIVCMKYVVFCFFLNFSFQFSSNQLSIGRCWPRDPCNTAVKAKSCCLEPCYKLNFPDDDWSNSVVVTNNNLCS